MIIQAHPMGNAFVHESAVALADAGLLREFWTGLDYPAEDRGWSWLPESWRREARRRQLPAAVKAYAHLRPWRELGRLMAPRLGCGAWTRHETGWCSVDRVMRDLDEAVARRLSAVAGVRGVLMYEDGAAASFAMARQRGLATFYDLPIGYWRAARSILREEATLSPEWAATLQGNSDSDAKLARKDAELALAEVVFIASSFTGRTLRDYPGKLGRVVLAPYGAPRPQPGVTPAVRQPDEPLRILFVGSLGQRKGLRYLLDAIDLLGDDRGYALTLIGTLPASPCPPLAAAVRRHRYIPSLPHGEIMEEMRRHHVLVLPSLFEGFGLVLTEAMANGLPVIATPHTAAPDILDEGVEGFVVPIRSAVDIARKLAHLHDDEATRQAMGAAALGRAAAMSWDGYRNRIVDAVQARLAPAPAH